MKSISKALAVLVIGAMTVTTAACTSPTEPAASDDPYTGDLTFWFWGEPDVPGINDWVQGAIDKYESLHEGINIELVPQATDTLQGAFETAAKSKSGPDIAMQWATLPVLTPVWRGDVAPLTGLVPEDEMANWLNTSENTYDGKVWAMPLYLLGVPFVWNKDLFAQAGLDPEHGPQTWDELLQFCEKLKAAGITPLTFGSKGGAFAAWFQALVGLDSLDSVKELQKVYTGEAKFTDPEYSGYLALLDEIVKKGYLNSDTSSLSAPEAWQNFGQGKAAMTWATDGNVAAWIEAGLGDSLGVQKSPSADSGALAEAYDATQSISAFITSWSPNKKQAATFLAWLHDPENLNSLYEETGAFPADKRFSVDNIKGDLEKELYKLDTLPTQVWGENYAPPQIDSQGLRSIGEAMIAGTYTPEEAAVEIQRIIEAWQTQQPGEFDAYKKWADG